MNDFLLKSRYPVVTVSFNTYYDRYQFTQHSSLKKDYRTRWNVPLFVMNVNTQSKHVIWFQKNSDLCSSDNFQLDPKATYIFNYGAFTYGRVKYSDALLAKMQSIDTTRIDAPSQLGMFLDQNDQKLEAVGKLKMYGN